jgi:hypothetical protein
MISYGVEQIMESGRGLWRIGEWGFIYSRPVTKNRRQQTSKIIPSFLFSFFQRKEKEKKLRKKERKLKRGRGRKTREKVNRN